MEGAASSGGSVTLLERLPVLQNQAKRDPEGWYKECANQYRRFEAELELLLAHPESDGKAFRALCIFLAHVAPVYRKTMGNLAETLTNVLEEHAEVLHGEVRRAMVHSLCLLRSHAMAAAVPTLTLFFRLFHVRDRQLRQQMFAHIITDIRTCSKGSTGGKTSRALQAFLYRLLSPEAARADPVGARKALQVLMTLFRRRVWTDARTVNVMAQGCLSPVPKVLVAALRFFLNLEGAQSLLIEDDTDDEGEGDGDGGDHAILAKRARKIAKKAAADARGSVPVHSKPTRSRVRRAKQAAKRAHLLEAKASLLESGGQTVEELLVTEDDPAAAAAAATLSHTRKGTFPAIQLLHDPQTLAEQMLRQLRGSGHRFEVRLLAVNLLTRIVGQHKLVLSPLYAFLQRYLRVHQQSVTLVLAYVVQACHELTPPHDLAPLVRAVADNFVTDRCPGEVIAVGLNTLREMFARVPLVLEEEGMDALALDLIQFRSFRGGVGGRGVPPAARAVLNVVRIQAPHLLRHKDRIHPKFLPDAPKLAYGQTHVDTGVAGAELLRWLDEADRLLGDEDDDGEEEEEEEEEVEEEDEGDEGEETTSDAEGKEKKKKGKGKKVTFLSLDPEDDDDEEESGVEIGVKRGRREVGSVSGKKKAKKATEDDGGWDEFHRRTERWERMGILGMAEKAQLREDGLRPSAVDVESDDEIMKRLGLESESSDEDDEEEEEDEDEDEEEGGEEEGEGDGSGKGEGTTSTTTTTTTAPAATSSSSSAASSRSAGGLSTERVLGPRDFERLARLRQLAIERSAELRGLTAKRKKKLKAQGRLTTTEVKVKRAIDAASALEHLGDELRRQMMARGGSAAVSAMIGEGVDEDELVGGDDAVISFDPEALESAEARKRRLNAIRVAKIEEEKIAKRKEKKGGSGRGGSSTNKEKRRKKNFMMLLKAPDTQKKLKRTLKEQQSSIRKHIKGLSKGAPKQRSRRRR